MSFPIVISRASRQQADRCLKELCWGVVKELTSQPHISTSSCSRKQTAEDGGDAQRCLSVISLTKEQAFVTIRVLSSLTKIPGCVVKVRPKALSSAWGMFHCVYKFPNWNKKALRLLYMHIHVCVWFFNQPVYVFRISCKDLKSMLSQVNYRVPNMRFLREKLPVLSFHLSQTPFPLHLLVCPIPFQHDVVRV